MIKETSDYDIFKKHKSNRDIDSFNLKKIKESIQTRNLLKWRPILVNEDMEVIDGQHRLEVSKLLNIPIYYEMQKNSEDEDIYLLNSNQKNWNEKDYLNYYLSKQKTEYIKFNEFIVKNKIKINDARKLLGFYGQEFSRKFKKGTYQHPQQEIQDNAVLILNRINSIVDLIKTKKNKGYEFCNSAYFKEALIYFLSKDEVDFDYFLKKIELCMEKLKKCMSHIYYQQIFLEIYNYRKMSHLLS